MQRKAAAPSPARSAPQRDFRSRVGRRSRAFGLRPIDLWPLLPAAERV